MQPPVHTFETIPSTNAEAFRLARRGAVHGETVWALTQTSGRGRLGRDWQSPAGKGLYFSMVLRPRLERETYPKLTMTAGLAVALALEEECSAGVELKWPNDIYLEGKKAGGILCEADLQGKDRRSWFAIAGIGLNVLTRAEDFSESLRRTASSLLLATGRRYEVRVLLEKIRTTLLDQVIRLEEDGFAPILEEWRHRDFLCGKALDWLTWAGEVVHGVSEGPDDQGQLLVRDRAGILHRVQSGDISLAGRTANKKGEHPNDAPR